jgi:hypothetical protein
MFKGKTNQPGFLAPLIHVDTVGEAIVNALFARKSTIIWLPGIARFLACLVWFSSPHPHCHDRVLMIDNRPLAQNGSWSA